MSNSSIENMGEMLPIFLIIMIVICVIAIVAIYAAKKSDDSKPLETKNITVLEKLVQQGKIEWYLIEDENGYRFKLRNFNADSLPIVVGDRGAIQYRGKTIVSFRRNKK
ncbi:MAG: hypothetical protein U0L06_07055 [Agathobacter sp.]|nr:hypothetical protein [Agathobacter sp.]